MDDITWDDSLSIGNEHIDAQHKRLFVLVNDVAKALREGHGKEVTSACLRRLCDYAVEHFAAEEALMDMDAYPEYDLHVREHMEGTTKALEFLQVYTEDRDVDMGEFLAFLANWVHTHIMQVDQTLGRYLKTRAAPV